MDRLIIQNTIKNINNRFDLVLIEAKRAHHMQINDKKPPLALKYYENIL
ncbi:DNA-directed RNA polymerase subunit omega [Candidatus Erwinia haradaeae]|uniref:DNA-directed RNA polymerase n=1 Tax=Candidatus Erwinia haradaeae TaxID=1922217 RepID=A0A451D3N1_9GAMM|nr:DNA-directed RNA polymerase subunit omega [Candidatus Erwinia haradaeae]VFP80281.1 DNA-directed RNA polymerase subunit omega [Candidatus Erwinia haradaeae]